MVSSNYKIKSAANDRVLYLIVYTVLILVISIILYPVIFIVSSSFSSPAAVSSGRVVLLPVEFGFQGYAAVFSHRLIVRAYLNTIFYTVTGTAINIAITLATAYPLSRKDCPFRKIFMFICVFTMFFSGGLIPTYILMTQINFINKVWVMIIPGALSVYHMIIVRTFMISSVPGELLDSAQIDGCSDTRYFFSILLPLTKPAIAVITLFYAVIHWNAYFNAMIYLNDQKLYPLQIILREILISNRVNLEDIVDPDLIIAKMGMADLLKYSLIIASSLPIIALYPFVQRFFIKGVMIGSIKG